MSRERGGVCTPRVRYWTKALPWGKGETMGFDIVRTPTLQAVATEDEQRLADDLQKRVGEAVSQAEAQPEVVQAATAQRVAEERLAGLQKAERILNQFAKQSRDQMAAMSQTALEAIVES